MAEIVKVLTVVLWASTKFLVGAIAAVGFQYNFFLYMVLLVVGGMLGIAIFGYANKFLVQLWRKFFPKKDNKVKFSRFKRFIVRLRQGYGLAGIAFLTPVILTVPIGAIVAFSLVNNRPRIFAYMFVSFIAWGAFIFGGIHVLGINFDFLGGH